MNAQDICLLAARTAKGPAFLLMAGQFLNLVLEELKLTRDLKMNRVTQILSVNPGTNGPFTLEPDYLRTYDMFYPLATPSGMTQFLTPITMEQYDAEFKGVQTANYPYEFATDLSTQALASSGTVGGNGVTGVVPTTPGLGYSSIPAVAFAGGGGAGAAAAAHVGILNPTFSGGSGYAAGDVVFGTAGTYTRPVKILVQAVVAGVPSSAQVVDAGDYSVLPGANSPTTTTGSGAGLLFTPVNMQVSSVAVTAGGSYTSAPTATCSGGGASVQAILAVSFGNTAINGGGLAYIYPPSSAAIQVTHRYMRNQPDIVTPESSTTVPWFPHTQYLVARTAAMLMGVTGDDRRDAFIAESDKMLAPYLIMEGDEQATVKSIKLDPRRFRSGRYARPTKTQPY